MTRLEFRELIDKKVVSLDGATGTELIKRGMPQGVSPELWALENPDAVNDIHNAYIAAGSDIVYVPSFAETASNSKNSDWKTALRKLTPV